MEPAGEEEDLQKDLAECVLESSYMFTLSGVALSIPLGVKYKVWAWRTLDTHCHFLIS